MTDAEAMAEIGRILDQWFRTEIGEFDALGQIAQVTGANRMSK